VEHNKFLLPESNSGRPGCLQSLYLSHTYTTSFQILSGCYFSFCKVAPSKLVFNPLIANLMPGVPWGRPGCKLQNLIFKESSKKKKCKRNSRRLYVNDHNLPTHTLVQSEIESGTLRRCAGVVRQQRFKGGVFM